MITIRGAGANGRDCRSGNGQRPGSVLTSDHGVGMDLKIAHQVIETA
jgi:hypothetical protein